MNKRKLKIALTDKAREFIGSLPEKVQKKITYNLLKVEGGEINEKLFKKLENSEIWEFRTLFNDICYRLFAFWDTEIGALIVVTHGIVKKTQKTPQKEIEKAGGIDILITSNMGMNEPGSPYNSKTRQITLNYTSRVAAASDFFGVEYVPHHAITMGIDTILKAKKIYYLAWGEGKAGSIKKLVEGNITDQVPGSYLQNHDNVDIFIDEAASVSLTRVETPWLTQKCEWTDYLTRKSVFWLCKKLDKPILKLTDRDYNDNGIGSPCNNGSGKGCDGEDARY